MIASPRKTATRVRVTNRPHLPPRNPPPLRPKEIIIIIINN